MDVNPVLATFTRGNWVENRHRGAFCIARADGTVVASAGDIAHDIFPRSAIKAIQALPILETGADARFALSEDALALACASHYGEPVHIEGVRAMLEGAGFTADDLECGAHPPTSPDARKALRDASEAPSQLHNNCSGKHAGMLAVARALDVDPQGYVTRDHAVQKRVRAAVEAVLAVPLTEHKCGTDGCSIPTWAAPLSSFAAGFARMATGESLPAETASAAQRLFDAATAHPFLIAGTGAFDTEAMAAFKGRLMIKIGAEGVFCGAIRDTGLGFALKCDDGNAKAATAMIAGLLKAVADPDADGDAVLGKFARQVSRNWRGIEVGTLEATAAVQVDI